MPPVIIGVAAAAGAAALGATVGVAVLAGVATAVVVNSVSKALTKPPKIPTFTPIDIGASSGGVPSFASGAGVGAGIRGQTINARQPLSNLQIVYGRTRVGGSIVHMETTSSNRFLHIVIAVAGHEIDAFEKVFFNDQLVTLDGNGFGFGGKARVQFKMGTDDQTAFASLVSESSAGWSNNHRLRGRACAYVRLEYDQDRFATGIPNISFEVRGKKVFDPRTNTTAWSANPALCISDYLTNTRFGLKSNYSQEIDQSVLIASANICDELVNLAGGGTEKRYEAHGVIDTGNVPEQILNRLLSAMAGKAVYVGGRWKILAGAYYTPTVSFDENDLIGGLRVQSLVSRRENFNAIKGVFSSAQDRYIATDFPPIVSQTFIAQDSGEEVSKSIELMLTTSASMAQRLAKIELLKARQQITVSLSLKLTALQVSIGDVILLNNTRMGWVNKPFEVSSLSVGLGQTLGVEMELRETAVDVYDWNASEEQAFDPAPNTNLPDPFDVEPPGIALTDRLAIINEQIASVLVINVTSSNEFARVFEVQVKKATDDDFTSLGQSTGNFFEFPFVEDDVVYEARARIINALGARSPFAFASRQIVGQTAPPQDVTGFSVNIVGPEAHFTWNAVPDLDLSHYKIRYSSLTVGATYSDAIDLIPKISRPATFATTPAMTGTYFIKSFDKSGIASINATEIVTLVDSIEGLNVVAISDQHPSFTGLKTNTVAVDGKLQLDTDLLFDSATGLFDSGLGNFDGGGGSITASGEYEFDDFVDLGNVYTSRVTAEIVTTRIDYVNTFDAAEGLFDNREGNFDGDVNAFDDVNVEFYVAITDDDPAGTPTWSDWQQFFVGDYTARAFKFKVVLTSSDPQATPAISVLSVEIDMPDRVTSGDDIASGTDAGGKLVTFNKAFKVAPALGIAAQNLQQGDFYEILTKTASGFTIRFKDLNGNVVNRTFDFTAAGYGALAI
jgi:hypothetical protein